MTRRRGGPAGRNFSGKWAKCLVKAIEDAGGEITVTSNSHLRVTGPGGIAVISTNGDGMRAFHKSIKQLKVYAGLDVRI